MALKVAKLDIKHESRAHAVLSASGSSRWLNCPPSVRQEELVKSTSSDYAREGTLAHEYSEAKLRLYFKVIDKKEHDKIVAQVKANELYDPEMDDYVQQYVDFIIEAYLKELEQASDLIDVNIEERVDYSEYAKDGFGTVDFNMVPNKILYITDLKYGRGIKVYASDNTQLMLYGIGAYSKYSMLHDIDIIRMTIVQPRLDHFDTVDIPAKELIKWAEEVVKPAADLAFKGEGVKKSGDWCRFCKVKARCRELQKVAYKEAEKDFSEPDLLSDEEILAAYNRIGEISSWIKAVEETVKEKASKGVKFEGYKLVAPKTNRKWIDDDTVIDVLLIEGYKPTDIYNQKVKGIGDISKLMGKDDFEDILGPYIVKPQGSPILVPLKDKRKEITVSTAAEDFAED